MTKFVPDGIKTIVPVTRNLFFLQNVFQILLSQGHSLSALCGKLLNYMDVGLYHCVVVFGFHLKFTKKKVLHHLIMREPNIMTNN